MEHETSLKDGCNDAFLDELDQFVSDSEKQLQAFLRDSDISLPSNGSIQEASLLHKSLLQCPMDPHHHIPKSIYDSHVRKCKLRKQSINPDIFDEEQAKSQSSAFCYQNCPNVVRLSPAEYSAPLPPSAPIPAPHSFFSIPIPIIPLPPNFSSGKESIERSAKRTKREGDDKNGPPSSACVSPNHHRARKTLYYNSRDMDLDILSLSRSIAADFIHSWKSIPRTVSSHFIALHLSATDKERVVEWIKQQVIHSTTSQRVSALLFDARCSPDELAAEILEYFHSAVESQQFVLQLWKRIALLITETKCPLESTHHSTAEQIRMIHEYLVLEEREKEAADAQVAEDVPSPRSRQEKSDLYDAEVTAAEKIRSSRRDMRPLAPEALLVSAADDSAARVKTREDIMSEQRDYRRRRQAYKGKSGSSKKTPTQTMRETINQRMEYIEALASKGQIKMEKIQR